MLHKINKLKVFNISIMTFYKKKKTVHDKYNQSFGGERWETWEVFQNGKTAFW